MPDWVTLGDVAGWIVLAFILGLVVGGRSIETIYGD